MSIQKTKEEIIELLVRCLESAPAPFENEISLVHPEDVQKWSDRYHIWFRDVRNSTLTMLGIEPVSNFYYQIDRLVQEANSIQRDLRENTEEEQDAPPPQTLPIMIGKIKTKKQDQ